MVCLNGCSTLFLVQLPCTFHTIVLFLSFTLRFVHLYHEGEWDMAYIPWEKLISPEAEGRVSTEVSTDCTSIAITPTTIPIMIPPLSFSQSFIASLQPCKNKFLSLNSEVPHWIHGVKWIRQDDCQWVHDEELTYSKKNCISVIKGI